MISKPATTMEDLQFDDQCWPRLSRSYTLNFMGDWGGAKSHRIRAWLSQEFCDRAGPGSRTATWTLRDGGMDSFKQLNEGFVDLAISAPMGLMGKALSGEGPFKTAIPHLRAIGTLLQNDRLVLALAPKYKIKTFEDLRRVKPALRLTTSTNDGTRLCR